MSNCICYITNFNDKEYLQYSLNSIINNTDNLCDIYILTLGETINIDYKFLKYTKIINCEELFYKYFNSLKNKETIGSSNWTKNVYLRLLIPFIEQLKKYDKILYLDTDIVAYKNLNNTLFNIIETDKIMSLFYSNESIKKIKKFILKYYFNYKFYLDENYNLPLQPNIRKQLFANAGVILFNNNCSNNIILDYENKINLIDKIINDPKLDKLLSQNDQSFINYFVDFNYVDSKNYSYNTPFADNNNKITVMVHYWRKYRNKLQKLIDIEGT